MLRVAPNHPDSTQYCKYAKHVKTKQKMFGMSLLLCMCAVFVCRVLMVKGQLVCGNHCCEEQGCPNLHGAQQGRRRRFATHKSGRRQQIVWDSGKLRIIAQALVFSIDLFWQNRPSHELSLASDWLCDVQGPCVSHEIIFELRSSISCVTCMT